MEATYRQQLAREPANVAARLALGATLHESGRVRDAVLVYRIGIALAPSAVEIWSNLGNSLLEMDEVEQAIAVCGAALTIDAEHFAAHNNLANALGRKGDLQGAAEHYRRAIQLKPEFVEAHSNLGTVLHTRGELDEAAACFRRALELSPLYAEARNNLGSVLGDLGRRDEAIGELNAAIQLRPDYAAAHWNLGLILLLQGDMQRGWAEYEWRRQVKNLIVPNFQFDRPRWQGEELHGKRILLHCEQGFGDAIQFVRYAPMVAERGGDVRVYCPPELVRLFKGVEGVKLASGWKDVVPDFDVHCPLLSLPNVFATSLKSVPANVPYVFADRMLSEKWSTRLGGEKGRKIGIAWAGRGTHTNDRRRSIPPAELTALGSVGEVRFVSLQKESALPLPMDMADWTGDLADFAETAALVNNLDLIISADTAVAHLAGAMGKPVWLLLPFAPDFRWMLKREDSPWYPTMRLFRQTTPGDWRGVVARVTESLGSGLA